MKNLVNKLSIDYPMIDFSAGEQFYWSPQKQQVCFLKDFVDNDKGQWTILHELGHALAGHNHYTYDLELLEMEAAAWQKAQEIAEAYSITIANDHIQDCLDTYRDWLHMRSTCPRCNSTSMQKDPRHYQCFNCEHLWRVTNSRLSRPYRLSVHKETTPIHEGQALFV